MRKLLIPVLLLFLLSSNGWSQTTESSDEVLRKGQFYFYWGYNRGWFSHSDIHFAGDDYDFTLYDVVAKDRQTPFQVDVYLNPKKVAIPQYNIRLGYFLNEHWDISIGEDHMKYVMFQDQMASISGSIANSGTPYDGTYADEDIRLVSDFLMFEHTDGLNYVNAELRRYDQLKDFGKISINLTEGAGFGIMIPRSNTTLLLKERYDEFHVAGFGFGALAGLNVTFWDRVFLQPEFKAGYIQMPDIRTTHSKVDRADQHFFYVQSNVVLGVLFGPRKVNEPAVD
ncbi:MAG: hypothetical protein HQ500_06730 [Flavobacteriales bacterium]|nr:hypothetical protein [Flavobacteriales bacterium]